MIDDLIDKILTAALAAWIVCAFALLAVVW